LTGSVGNQNQTFFFFRPLSGSHLAAQPQLFLFALQGEEGRGDERTEEEMRGKDGMGWDCRG
jgi:hypothetical protein